MSFPGRSDCSTLATRGLESAGGVVVCENGVLGLMHFARAESPETAREVYVVPLQVWAEEWPALSTLVEPLIDAPLRAAAIAKRAPSLEIGTDINIALVGYRDNLYIKRPAETLARAALAQHGGVIIVGRPKSGKTRLAWQLLQEYGEALIIIPKPTRLGEEPPSTFEAAGLAGSDVVLFFDDLQLTSKPLEWRRRLRDAIGRNRRCLILCTSRDGTKWKEVQDNHAPLLEALGRDNGCVYTSRVARQGKAAGEDLSRTEGWQLAQSLGLSLLSTG
jgi:hypothetical protein